MRELWNLVISRGRGANLYRQMVLGCVSETKFRPKVQTQNTTKERKIHILLKKAIFKYILFN